MQCFDYIVWAYQMQFLQEMRIAHLIRYLRYFFVFIKFLSNLNMSASAMVRPGARKIIKTGKEIKKTEKKTQLKMYHWDGSVWWYIDSRKVNRIWLIGSWDNTLESDISTVYSYYHNGWLMYCFKLKMVSVSSLTYIIIIFFESGAH